MSSLLARSSATAALVLAAVACSDSTTEPLPPDPVTATLTVDAASAPAYVKLGVPAQSVTVADPTTSSAWDIRLVATTLTLNGGAAGPGGVSGYCICDNANATDAQVRTMTPESQLAAFEAVTASSIPAEASFQSDLLTPAIAAWYTGSGAATVAAPARTWIVRRGAGGALLAKFRVTNIAGATATNAGSITFEYAVQAAAGAPFGTAQTRTVDVRGGDVYFDLGAGATSTAAGTWDLRLGGFAIRTNGGASGSGAVSALLDATTPFATIDAAYAGTAPPQAFRRDAFGGVFSAQPWYRYNITGTDNQIWPTFNVYLVKRGADVYKVQLTSYYSVTGASRQITLRSAKLR